MPIGSTMRRRTSGRRTDLRSSRGRSLTNGLDAETYLHVVREDTAQCFRCPLPRHRARRAWYSRDDGASWESLRLNMPTVAIVDLVVAVKDDDLVVGTLGRSAWILDDLTAVRLMSDADRYASEPAHLFAPLAATALALSVRHRAGRRTARAARTLPQGAIVTYFGCPQKSGRSRSRSTVHDGSGQCCVRHAVEQAIEDPYCRSLRNTRTGIPRPRSRQTSLPRRG